jgi:hypothetical protein
MKKILTIITTLCLITSCVLNDEDNVNFDPQNILTGNWSYVNSEKGETIFERKTTLPENNYGISFDINGKVIERTAGWCGTPPLEYIDIEGTYQFDKNLIKVYLEGFPSGYIWRIESLTNQKLVVSYVQESQEEDLKELKELFDEIQAMIKKVKCTNGNDWSITSYGSKACGGVQGYLAYPNSINKELFLEKVGIYTQKEYLYNEKWDVISTCEAPAQPVGVECNNDVPVLIY